MTARHSPRFSLSMGRHRIAGMAMLMALSMALSLGLASRATSTEVQPGVRYAGEARLDFPAAGASFVLPAGWAGVLPQGAEYFVMESQGYVGYVFAGADVTTAEEARRVMVAPIDVGDGITFHPKGDLAVEDPILTGSYTVQGAAVELVGRIRTVVGEHGWGVAFIGASTPDQVQKLTSAMVAMSASLQLSAPASASASGNPAGETGSGGGGGASSSASGSSGPWLEELNGRKLSHFFTRSGYTEEDYIWLCSGGRFYQSFNSGGFGGGASGAFESQNGGRWSVSGPLEGGTLVLAFNDGSTARYSVTHEGTKLFLDGKRYFRETGACQ